MVARSMLRTNLLVSVLLGALALAAPAQARPRTTTVRTPQGTVTTRQGADGVRHLAFRWGPVTIHPGQNTISLAANDLRPPGPGWITSFKPNLTYVDGKSPSVKIVHLHHAVWLVGDDLLHLKPTFAAGEEKTNFNAPTGFGWRYTTKQTWVLNHMIHDLTAARRTCT